MSIVTMFKHPKMIVAAKPLITFISQIITKRYEEVVEQLRYYDDKNLETQFLQQRRHIPRISIAANFKSSDYEIEMISYSGFVFFEIPYLHPKKYDAVKLLLKSNPYVFASFRNAMGHGICFVIKSSEGYENHKNVFRIAHKYFSKKLETKGISKDGLDIEYLILMSCDSKAHLNIACIPFGLNARLRY